MTKTRLHTGDEILKVYPFSTRLHPHVIPSADICDEPTVCIALNREWASHIAPCLVTLTFDDMWLGTPEEIYAAQQKVWEIYLMFNNPCGDGTSVALINQQTYILQQQIIQHYDGTITSIDQDAPETNFNSDPEDTGDDAENRNAALCHAVHALVEMLCAQALAHYGNDDLLIGIASGVLGLLLGPPGAVIGFAIVIANALYEHVTQEAFLDQEAKDNVACCLLSYFNDLPNTLANFKGAGNACYTTGASNEAQIMDAVRNSTLLSQENYLVFLKVLAEGMRYAELGLIEPCPCNQVVRLSGFGNSGIASLPIGGAPAAVYVEANDTYTGGFNLVGPGGIGGRLFDLRLTVDDTREIVRIKLITSAHRTRDSGATNLQVIAHNGIDLQSTAIPLTATPEEFVTEWTGSITGQPEIRFYAGVEVLSENNGNISTTRLEVDYAL